MDLSVVTTHHFAGDSWDAEPSSEFPPATLSFSVDFPAPPQTSRFHAAFPAIRPRQLDADPDLRDVRCDADLAADPAPDQRHDRHRDAAGDAADEQRTRRSARRARDAR